jgi:hypothetical protein
VKRAAYGSHEGVDDGAPVNAEGCGGSAARLEASQGRVTTGQSSWDGGRGGRAVDGADGGGSTTSASELGAGPRRRGPGWEHYCTVLYRSLQWPGEKPMEFLTPVGRQKILVIAMVH